MNLSVVIVNWNSGRHLRRALHSLSELRGELRDVWVIDNASSDSSLEGFSECTGVRVVHRQTNLGFAQAANEGIFRASSDFVLLSNPDVEVIPESVRRLYEEMEGQPLAAIVCGPLTDSRGKAQRDFQIRKLPTWRSVLFDALFLDELLAVIGQTSKKPDSASREPARVEQPAADFWLLRKTAWEEVGGFDPRFYPAWFEDVDFCKRLQAAGWEILYFPELPVFHRGGLCLGSLPYPRFIRIFYGNLLKYLKKHHPYTYPLLWLPVQCGMWIRYVMTRK